MKKIIILLTIIMFSCSNYEKIDQEIIVGKISAIDKSIHRYQYHRYALIYIQNDKTTKSISIPDEFENRWNVGDRIILIVEKYKVTE